MGFVGSPVGGVVSPRSPAKNNVFANKSGSMSSAQAMDLLGQIEAMVAEGPQGKLDEYLPVVDLLLNMRKLLKGTGERVGLRAAEELIHTAMEDLEYEFQEILHRRSMQSGDKYSVKKLKEIYDHNFLSPGRASAAEEMQQEERKGGGREGGGEGGEEGGKAGAHEPITAEVMPESAVRWLNQMARRMVEGGAGAQCIQVYRAVRAEAMRRLLEDLAMDKMKVSGVEDMSWETLEKLCKDWLQAMYTSVGVVLGMERRCCEEVWRGMPSYESACMRLIVEESEIGVRVLHLLSVLKAIVNRKMPEQLFATLDMFQVVEEVMPELDANFRVHGYTAVWMACVSLPKVIASAVAGIFDRFRELLEDVPSSSGISSPKAKTKKSALRNLLMRSSSKPTATLEEVYELVPKGGGVDPVTSYVANYIRHYMERQGKRSYINSLAQCFLLLEDDAVRGLEQRSMERETAKLITALRKNLEARSHLYPEQALREIFLMNNMHYLVKSMSQWHGWHNKGLIRTLSHARREGAKDLMVAIGDLEDDRLVQLHGGNFQSIALLNVLGLLQDAANNESSSLSLKAEYSRLKKFNTAFEELKTKQQEWTIPDDDLRKKMCSKWATMIKDRYFKMLLLHWTELTSCKYYLHTPESLEAIILDTFFLGPEEM